MEAHDIALAIQRIGGRGVNPAVRAALPTTI